MRAFITMMCLAVLGTACSAPVPRNETRPEDISYAEYDADAPQNDAVCMSMDSLDALIEAANRPAPTCEYPQPEIIIVPTECPDVTVTCESEVVEIEVPVEVPAECPEVEACEPEACEPEIVEIEVRQPSFELLDSPIAVDPSTRPDEQFRFLDVVLLGGERDARAIFLGFVLQRFDVASGYDYGTWGDAETCAVFDCESIRMYRVFDDGTYVVVLDAFDMETEAYSWYTFSTPTTWGHDLAADARDYFSLYARVREDAPPGRYKLTLSQYEVMHGETWQTIIGPRTVVGFPNNGSEFTVAERAPVHCAQPQATVLGIAPADNTFEATRKLVAHIFAPNCEFLITRFDVSFRRISDLGNDGGEDQAALSWDHTSHVQTVTITVAGDSDPSSAEIPYHATEGLSGGVIRTATAWEGFSTPAGEKTIIEIVTSLDADILPGEYLMAVERVEGTILNEDRDVRIDGMPLYGMPFTITD